MARFRPHPAQLALALALAVVANTVLPLSGALEIGTDGLTLTWA